MTGRSWHLRRDVRARDDRISRDAALSALAADQHGVVDLEDLRSCGLSKDAVLRRVNSGLLRRKHAGVYVLGHETPRTRVLAAVRACGPGSVATAFSAALVRGLTTVEPAHHMVLTPTHCRPAGVDARRANRVRPKDHVVLDRIPVTTVPRLLLDLAASAPLPAVQLVMDAALLQNKLDPAEMLDLVDHAAGFRGVPALRAVLADIDTRSRAERFLKRTLPRFGVPTPEYNAMVGIYRVDALWRDQRVILEVDGFAFHRSRAAFERDHRQDLELAALGYRTIRATAAQLTRADPDVKAVLQTALA